MGTTSNYLYSLIFIRSLSVLALIHLDTPFLQHSFFDILLVNCPTLARGQHGKSYSRPTEFPFTLVVFIYRRLLKHFYFLTNLLQFYVPHRPLFVHHYV